MEKKLSKIVGLSFDDFKKHVKAGDIKLRNAHLIPTLKVGDEMALTSVLLSSMRMVKEFRSHIKSDIKMSKGGSFHAFTEVEFPEFKDCRVDGLFLVVKAGIIKDAALMELKKGNNPIEQIQIEKYVEIAKKFNIPKLVTVSNEYVSEPSQHPLCIKTPKGLDLYHFSWSYLLTISHLLLFKNDMNIEDEDQVEIMKEVVSYFEHDRSGICGFNQMKKGWSKTVEDINAGTLLRSDDKMVREAVLSWQQEERDIALMLSRKLGVLVKSGDKKYKESYSKRIEDDTKELLINKHLYSTFSIDGAVSDVYSKALLKERTIEMCVNLKVPKNKTLKGQIGWIRKQFDFCEKKSPKIYAKNQTEYLVEVLIKNVSKPVRVNLKSIDMLNQELAGKEIRECKIIQLKDFGKSFSSRAKFVIGIEQMIQDFYSGVVENLKKWEPSAPKLKKESKNEDSTMIDTDPEDIYPTNASEKVEPIKAPEQIAISHDSGQNNEYESETESHSKEAKDAA